MIKLILILIITIITYFLIFTNTRIRTSATFLGAILAIALGLIKFDRAITFIDFNKLGIIIGMMIFIIIAKESGIFEYLALKVTIYSKGNPILLLIYLSLLTGFLSSILDVLTTLFFLANITIALTSILEIPALPFLISEIIFANIGGLATYIGTPVNITIGSAAKFSFYNFFYHMAPISIILMSINLLYLIIIFKNTFKPYNLSRETISHFSKIDIKKVIVNASLYKNSLLILGITILVSFFSPILHLDLAIIYLLGAITLLLISHDKPDEIYAQIDWRIIFFLIGLNILAGTLEENGLVEIISSKIIIFSGKNLKFLTFIILGFSTFSSAFFDNIPIVTLAIPIIENVFHQLGFSFTSLIIKQDILDKYKMNK